MAAPALPGTSLSVSLGMFFTSCFAEFMLGVFPFCCGFLEVAVSVLLAPSMEVWSGLSMPVLELDWTEEGRLVTGFVFHWNTFIFCL